MFIGLVLDWTEARELLGVLRVDRSVGEIAIGEDEVGPSSPDDVTWLS